jgi:hypothetical protein
MVEIGTGFSNRLKNRHRPKPTAHAYASPMRALVDEAIHQILAAGVIVKRQRGWETNLRLRYFGPCPLTFGGNEESAFTLIVNLGWDSPAADEYLYTKLYTIRRVHYVRLVRLARKTRGKTPLVISPWGRQLTKPL